MVWIIFFAILGLAAAPAATDTEEFVIKLLRPGGRKADINAITDANRDSVINLLRDIATLKVTKIGTVLPSELSAEIILLRLKDKQTIERLMDNYRKGYGSRGSFWLAEHLEWSGQAAIIPYLAEDFSRDDGDKSTIIRHGREGIRVAPRSVFSALTTLRIAAASEQLSEEMRSWAVERQKKTILPFADFRVEMRQWWKQNEAAFARGDYAGVRPPQPVPGEETPPKPEKIPEANIPKEPPRPATSPSSRASEETPLPATLVSSPVPMEAPPRRTDATPAPASNSLIWLWGAAAALLAFAAVIFNRKK